MLRTKYIKPEFKVLDEKNGTITAVVSTETRDRDGDIIRQAGWSFERFFQQPIMLAGHNYADLRAVIGEWSDMTVKGKKTIGAGRYFLEDDGSDAQAAFRLAKRGLAAFSVGFIPDMDKAVELKGGGLFPNYEFNGQELLEVSQVTVPSNPDAVSRMKGIHPVLDEVLEEATAESAITYAMTWQENNTTGYWEEGYWQEGKLLVPDVDIESIATRTVEMLQPELKRMTDDVLVQIKAMLPRPAPKPSKELDVVISDAINKVFEEV